MYLIMYIAALPIFGKRVNTNSRKNAQQRKETSPLQLQIQQNEVVRTIEHPECDSILVHCVKRTKLLMCNGGFIAKSVQMQHESLFTFLVFSDGW